MTDEPIDDGRPDEEAFFVAVAENDPEAVDRLLAERPELAWARNDDDIGPVLVARYGFALGALERLLDARGDDLDVFEAAAVGRADLVRGALAEDSHAALSWTPDGFTALHLAAFFGTEEAIGALLEAGAELDAPSRNTMRVTPLHAAAASRHVAICRTLVERGADVNAVQRAGFTPLMAAAENGDGELVELLLAAGADATRRADDGRTAADLARAAGHAPLALRLEA